MYFPRFKPHGLSHSGVITLIALLENYASAMLSLVVPLYLFAFLQSELAVGQVGTVGSFFAVATTVALGFLLTRFPRGTLYKVGIGLCLGSIALLFLLSHVTEAYLSRVFFFTANALTPAILSLYIRDLTLPKNLPHTQGFYVATVNLAWLTGPMLAGWLVQFFGERQATLTAHFPFLQLLDARYFNYTLPLIFALLLYLIALAIFSWQKFVRRHPHLQETADSAANDRAHHHGQLANWRAYFADTFRTQAFINFTFISFWWVAVFTYFPILLERHGVAAAQIGILLGLITLPNVLFERFIDRVLRAVGGSPRALLFGYGFFGACVTAAAFVGPQNIWLFAGLIIASQLGVAITEPLQELQFFEGTTRANQNQFYALHLLGGRVLTFLGPVIFGWLGATFGLDAVFRGLPLIFVPLFIALFFSRRAARATSVKI